MSDNPGKPLDFADLHREAAGVLQLHLIGPSLGRQIFAWAAEGDAYCFAIACGLARSLARITSAPPGGQMLCLCCPAQLSADDALTFILATGRLDQPTSALGAALCPACGCLPDRSDRVATALKRVWPDLRPIQISEAVGHA